MTPIIDQITKLQIVLPKLLGPVGGALAGVIISWLTKHGFTLDADTASNVTLFITTLCTLLGYSLTSLMVTSQTNPANVANPKAAPAAPAGAPNVTSEPVADAEPPAKAELRG